MLLLVYCLMHFPLFVEFLCSSLFWYALLSVLSSFAIILKRKRTGWFAFLSYGRLVNALHHGLQCAIVV